MTIDEHLYIGTLSEKAALKLVKKIKKSKPCEGVFVITLPLFDDGLLEIYNFNELLQKFYQERLDDIHIVGISMTRKGAYYLSKDIINDVYNNTGAFNCTEYFEKVL